MVDVDFYAVVVTTAMRSPIPNSAKTKEVNKGDVVIIIGKLGQWEGLIVVVDM